MYQNNLKMYKFNLECTQSRYFKSIEASLQWGKDINHFLNNKDYLTTEIMWTHIFISKFK